MFTGEISIIVSVKTKGRPVNAAEYPKRARRPYHSMLDYYQTYRIGFHYIRCWRQALGEYLKLKGHLS
jgi:dTDP-4-dehydrorhamnose reductase